MMNHHASRFIWLKSVLIGLAGLLTVLAASGPPTLALPPLIIGLILLWFSQLEAIQANSRLHQASVMISVWGLILGIGLFVTNAGITLWAQSRTPSRDDSKESAVEPLRLICHRPSK